MLTKRPEIGCTIIKNKVNVCGLYKVFMTSLFQGLGIWTEKSLCTKPILNKLPEIVYAFKHKINVCGLITSLPQGLEIWMEKSLCTRNQC